MSDWNANSSHHTSDPGPYPYGGQPGPYPAPVPPQPPRKRRTGRMILAVLAVLFGCVLLAGVVATAMNPGPSELPTTVTTQAGKPATTAAPAPSPKVTHKPAPPTRKLTTSQEQAMGSARAYLKVKGFSRAALIDQLTSQYGAGFPLADATYAVDHIGADWNEQAAREAKSYLQVQNFSRSALIHQLESEYGGKYTHAQAVYGVTAVGL